MPTSVKKVILNKSISDVMYHLYPKTSADVVVYSKTVDQDTVETTVAAELLTLATGLAATDTSTEVTTKVTNAIDALRREIMGLGENETVAEAIGEAYDTIKEIAAFLAEHEDAENAASYLSKVATLESLVGHAAVAQVGEEGDQDYVAPVSATGLFAADAALASRIAALEAVGACKVEDGDTNGTIKINDVTVTVYDGDPTLIQQDATHRFVSDVEKTKWNGLIQVVASLPAQADADTLYCVEIPSA